MDGSINQSAVAGSEMATNLPPELVPISWMCTGPVQYLEEGGRRFVHMQGLKVLVGKPPNQTEQVMDALLALNSPNPSYPTRLFLPASLGLGLNWHETAYILGRAWVTWSWNNVPANQAPAAILADHLAAFQ